MQIFGVPLRKPGLSDFPMVAFNLALAALFVGLSMFVLGWDIGQASAIIYSFTAATIASACGVNLRTHGLRGFLVIVLIMVALVATTVGLHLMLK